MVIISLMRSTAMWQNEGFQLFGELLSMDGHKKAVLFFELFSIISSSDSAPGKGEGVT